MMRYRIKMLVAALCLTGCQLDTLSDPATAQEQASQATSSHEIEPRKESTMNQAKVSQEAMPEDFDSYAMQQVGDGQLCVVGALSDADGINQSAHLYLLKQDDRSVVWGKSLGIPADTFQSRATHCAASDNALFVLVQADTQPQQQLSQTLLSVSKLDRRTGETLLDKSLPVKRFSGAYSFRVVEGADNFFLKNGILTVDGDYVTAIDRDNPQKITLKLDDKLAQ